MKSRSVEKLPVSRPTKVTVWLLVLSSSAIRHARPVQVLLQVSALHATWVVSEAAFVLLAMTTTPWTAFLPAPDSPPIAPAGTPLLST